MEKNVLLVVEDLHVTIGSGSKATEAVRGVSLTVSSGEILGIVGESGSGKSLSVAAIAGLLPDGVHRTEGMIRFKGEDLANTSRHRLSEIRGRELAMVFQDSLTSLNPVMRIGHQVQEPLLLHRMASAREASRNAEEKLRALGIPDSRHAATRFPHEFSGGMRQRAMIATALIASPQLIIADEPTTALDVTVQAQILEIFRRLNRELGVALILISHDLGVMSEVAHSMAVMYAGRIVEYGATDQLLSSPQHPYTRALLQSMPLRSGGREYELQPILGEPPSPDALPSGCPFHPRCTFAEHRCVREEPLLQPVTGSVSACWVAHRHRIPPPDASRISAVERGGPNEARAVAPLLRIDNVVKHYPVAGLLPFVARSEVHALDDVSLSVQAGETIGIVGESGCGKSTLARCILRLTPVDSGKIIFRGHDITTLGGEELRLMRRHMQPVFQDPFASLNPSARISDIVAEPLVAHEVSTVEREQKVVETLDLVGLGNHYMDRFPHQLSGGQRQRVGIARALVLDPELIVADEPISALDVSIQAQIVNLLKDLKTRLNLTLIFISHDLRMVRHLSNNIAIMFLGKIVEYGPTEEVATRPRHPYTAALLSAVPALGSSSNGSRIILSGDPPSPLTPPSGCRFRTRCPRADDMCAEVEPPLGPTSQGHKWACHFPLEVR